MKVRAISDLNSLSDQNFFSQLSEGMNLIIENCAKLNSEAQILRAQEKYRGFQILRNIAVEEASKFMILLDSVRCDRTSGSVFARQLRYFNDHLAKGIYSEYYEIKPATYKEVLNWVRIYRDRYYLDGPNDVDWIFYNSILFERENKMYVDYIEADDEHQWISPQFQEDNYRALTPTILPLSIDMHACGFSKPESLEVIASLWRPIEFNEDFHWQDVLKMNNETIDQLINRTLLEEVSPERLSRVINKWLFPLHSIDLRILETKTDQLREEQNNWSPY